MFDEFIDKPRRSALFVPGSNERALKKSLNLTADVLIFDLEDSVAPERKAAARRNILNTLRTSDFKAFEIAIRTNHVNSDYFQQDIALAHSLKINAVVIPKVEHAKDIKNVERHLQGNHADQDIKIWFMIETPRGVLNASSIADASAKNECMLLGTEDLAKDLQVPETPGRLAMISHLSHCVLAARAAGISVLDGVFKNFSDNKGLKKTCEQGRNIGFDGKCLIHPDQIETTNALFRPSIKEIEQAAKIITAWEQAREAGKEVAVLNGEMIEHLHVQNAKRLLKKQAFLTANER